MTHARYVIEGEWTGYTSAQRHVVHRTVHSDPTLREWIKKNSMIRYTDGTALVLSCRDLGLYERITEQHGYDSLIADCFRQNVNSVAALVNARPI